MRSFAVARRCNALRYLGSIARAAISRLSRTPIEATRLLYMHLLQLCRLPHDKRYKSLTASRHAALTLARWHAARLPQHDLVHSLISSSTSARSCSAEPMTGTSCCSASIACASSSETSWIPLPTGSGGTLLFEAPSPFFFGQFGKHFKASW